MEKKFYVSNKNESARMFQSDFLDYFSRVPFYVPLIIYIPVITYFMYQAYISPEISVWIIGGLFLLGMLFWSASEYFLHRFVFHFEPKSKLGQRMHFIFHGVHHDYPNDSLRLVMPPSVSIPLAFFFYWLFGFVFTGTEIYPFFSGYVAGYLCYDMVHYAIHHVEMKGKLWAKLKTHHIRHHYADPENGFGVSSPLWDMIVGTNFEKGKVNQQQKKKILN